MSFKSWPATFAKIFDRLFGSKHFTLSCFTRCAAASLLATSLMWAVSALWGPPPGRYSSLLRVETFDDALPVLVANIVPDYLAYLLTRLSLRQMISHPHWIVWIAVIALDSIAILYLSNIAVWFGFFLWERPSTMSGIRSDLVSLFRNVIPHPFQVLIDLLRGFQELMFGFPAFLTMLWLWLYAGSGVILKLARRFDIGFAWFNRRFDIEKKPLQSIGLVAGAFAAACFWALAISGRLMS